MNDVEYVKGASLARFFIVACSRLCSLLRPPPVRPSVWLAAIDWPNSDYSWRLVPRAASCRDVSWPVRSIRPVARRTSVL